MMIRTEWIDTREMKRLVLRHDCVWPKQKQRMHSPGVRASALKYDTRHTPDGADNQHQLDCLLIYIYISLFRHKRQPQSVTQENQFSRPTTRYDTIDDLHRKTDRQAASLI